METIIIVIILAFSFILMPLAFFYIFVVMPLKKRIRCSELVEGTIKWIDKEVRTSYDSEGRHHHGVFYIATCEYYYGGKEYTSTVESMNKKFKVSKGEVLQFYINPKNPLETYYRNARQVIKMFIFTAFFTVFICGGVVAIKDFIKPSNEAATVEQVKNTDETNSSNTDYDSKNEDLSKINTENNEIMDEDLSEIENIYNRIILNKSSNNDMNNLFIKKARKVSHVDVSFYIPESYELEDGNEVESTYVDSETGEQFKITVGYTEFTKKKANAIAKKELKENPVQKFTDYYIYNGYKYKMMYSSGTSRIVYVLCLANNKTVFIKYVPSKNTQIDLRDILSTMVI